MSRRSVRPAAGIVFREVDHHARAEVRRRFLPTPHRADHRQQSAGHLLFRHTVELGDVVGQFVRLVSGSLGGSGAVPVEVHPHAEEPAAGLANALVVRPTKLLPHDEHRLGDAVGKQFPPRRVVELCPLRRVVGGERSQFFFGHVQLAGGLFPRLTAGSVLCRTHQQRPRLRCERGDHDWPRFRFVGQTAGMCSDEHCYPIPRSQADSPQSILPSPQRGVRR